jgi:plastocyanin
VKKSLGATMLGALVVCLLPAGALAATKTVTAGPPLKAPPKGVPEYSDITMYFPSKVTIREGDSVKWNFAGFHNVLFPGKAKAPALVIADPSTPVKDAKDAAGALFWFNGQANLFINPKVAFPESDGVVDKNSADNSGLPLSDGPPEPFTAKFTRTGTYTYVCSVHPLMKGKVTVVKKNRKVPSARQDKRTVAKQLAKALKTLKQKDKFKGPSGANVLIGNDTKDISLLAYYPKAKTVKTGETVRFKMSAPTNEIHTVTFGPEAYNKGLADTFFGPEPGAYSLPPRLLVNPVAAYPSDPPTGPIAYNGATHGNGFLNSGVLDADAKSPQAAEAAYVFTKAGTYTYYCLVHGAEMKGTITAK